MIRVTIELVPGGDESRKVRIAGADIANITALAKLSDYDASMFEDASPITGKPAIVYRHQLSGHNREQSVWALIEKVAAGWVNIDHDAVVWKSIEGHGG